MYTSEFEYQIEIFVLSSIDLKQTKLCVLYWHIFFQVRRAILGKKIKATNMGGGAKCQRSPKTLLMTVNISYHIYVLLYIYESVRKYEIYRNFLQKSQHSGILYKNEF